MGIPSYFTYIIKNYPNIVKRIYEVKSKPINALYMDSNSIIYDVVRKIDYPEGMDRLDYETMVIDGVIEMITNYMMLIQPTQLAMIAFDGVAPLAKMDQQRERRFKSQFFADLEQEKVKKWDTAAITPGTDFMKTLTKRIKQYYQENNDKYGFEIKLSGSDEKGEGEHKIFKEIREYGEETDRVIVYGLDADLIMLSLFHEKCVEKIYTMREAPEYIKILSTRTDNDEFYYLDINELSDRILLEMGVEEKEKMKDYCIMCFLLGNDFLPHVPALNVRTSGSVTVLLEVYNELFGKKGVGSYLSNENGLNWENMIKLFSKLEKKEEGLMVKERKHRAKIKETLENKIDNIPIKYDMRERAVRVGELGWRERYNEIIMNHKEKDACELYIEGLEWVYHYYNGGDVKMWRNKYLHVGLMGDLKMACERFIKREKQYCLNRKEFTEKEQLEYVLSYNQLWLLGEEREKELKETKSDKYPKVSLENGNRQWTWSWAYKRYHWESRVELPEIF